MIKPLEEPIEEKDVVQKLNEIIVVLNEIIKELGLKIKHHHNWKDEYPD